MLTPGPATDPVPRPRLAHIRISDYLRTLLREIDGAKQPRLPTDDALATQFRVSRQTVRRAYADLVAEGLVKRSPGKGSFPTDAHRYLANVGSVDDLLCLAADQVLEIITPLSHVRDAAAATKLGLPTDDVGYVTYRLLYKGAPYGFTRVHLPPFATAALSGADFLHEAGVRQTETVIEILNRRLANPVAMARETIIATAASTDVASVLGCEVARPVLSIEILYFDADSRPIQLCVHFLNSDMFEYRAQLQRRMTSASTVWSTSRSSQIADNGASNR